MILVHLMIINFAFFKLFTKYFHEKRIPNFNEPFKCLFYYYFLFDKTFCDKKFLKIRNTFSSFQNTSWFFLIFIEGLIKMQKWLSCKLYLYNYLSYLWQSKIGHPKSLQSTICSLWVWFRTKINGIKQPFHYVSSFHVCFCLFFVPW